MATIQTIWSQSDTGKKTGIIVGAGFILIFLIVASVWLFRTDYQVLFSGMEPRDAAVIVDELERMKVDYRFEEAGTRIVVPSGLVHKVRLKLMGSEMAIAGTVGLEIFNDSDFGMTEFAQKINFQRALQGELTRTIMSLDEVKYARVHLVMPESGLFKSQGKEPSASVTLFLKHGQIPDAQMISGIQRLVSSSVPELDASMVTVSDQRGQTLSGPPSDAMGIESISKRLEKQQEVENYYAGKIVRLLESRYDTNEIAVSVNVSLSYDQVSITRKGVLGAEEGVTSGVLRRRESSFGADGSKEKGKRTKNTEVEYELGHQIEQKVEAPGRIIKISVGVLVPPDLDDQQRQEINKLVSMVIGFDESRGDAVAIYSSRYMDSPVAETASVTAFVAESVADTEAVPLVDLEAEAGSVVESPISSISLDKIVQKVKSAPLLFAVFGALIVFTLLVAWFLLGSRKGSQKSQAPVLDQAEKERVLAKVQEWLAGDEVIDQSREVKA